METLYIALDGGRKLTIGSLQSLESKSFKLRTVDINQFQAKIAVGITGGNENHIFHSVFLKNLKPASNGYSYLNCRVTRKGRKLSLIIKNERRTICDDTFSLLTPASKKKILYGSLGGVAALILIIALILLVDFSALGSGFTGSQTISGSRQISGNQTAPNSKISSGGTPSNNQSSATSKTSSTSESSDENQRGSQNQTASNDLTAKDDQSAADTKSESSESVVAAPDRAENTNTSGENSPSIEPSSAQVLLPLSERTILFTPNSSSLTNEGIKVLEKILTLLLEEPDLHVNITGHCAIAGTEAGRREISIQRAENVEAWLKKRGWKPEIDPIVDGKAGDFPLTLDPEKQELNRRVEISY